MHIFEENIKNLGLNIPDIPKATVAPSPEPVAVAPQPEIVAVPESPPIVEESIDSEPKNPVLIPQNEPEPEVVAEMPPTEMRIWPWPSGEPWDARQVHREVVTALEQAKSGHVEEAKGTIDTLGPHLTDENIDLIYHIGMVLKQIDRVDDVKSMLERAKAAMPDNEHVSSAVAYLGV